MERAVIRPVIPSDRVWVEDLIGERWGSSLVVARGVLYEPAALPGFVALLEGAPAGLLTYHMADGECEIVTLDSLRPGLGIGTALLAALLKEARRHHARRAWLITTNDNLHALGFYQRRGFVLVRLYPNALAGSRRLKPQIPLIGATGIPLRDEIELEINLEARSDSPDSPQECCQ